MRKNKEGNIVINQAELEDIVSCAVSAYIKSMDEPIEIHSNPDDGFDIKKFISGIS